MMATRSTRTVEELEFAEFDTPELGQPRSFAARERLQQLLHSGTVTVEPRAVDKYGRTVGIVRVNGQDVAAILRAEGYAKPR
jgi:endonuclease YncB( thermonuclease family)